MTDQEFAAVLEQLVALGHETPGAECKPPGPRTDKPLFLRVVKAVLGMSNRLDGGLVIIGVEDTGNTLNPVGLNGRDQVTWNYNHVSDGLKEYAEPSVSFELDTNRYQGKDYVVLTVREFQDIPILCKKPDTVSGRIVLREGACYVRSRRKPETTEVPSQEDMRELLDLATEKRLRALLALVGRAGGAVVPIPSVVTPIAETATDQELFERQRGDLR